MSRALVTGGAGFIGSHLVERLLREGHAVRVLDNFTTGKRTNLASVVADVDVIEGDVRDADAVTRAVAGCDWVFHEAAIVSVPYSVAHPDQSTAVNLVGTLNVLQAAHVSGSVQRVVFASSAAIYGSDPALPKTESMPASPVAPYGAEKYASEVYLATWHRLHGLRSMSLRYFNVFGPRQDPSSPYSGVISVFVQRALARQPVTVFGDGLQSRDFVFVGDVVDANYRAAISQQVGAVNVGRGASVTLLDLLATLGESLGHAIDVRHEPARAGDIRDSLADVSLAKKLLGFEAKTSLREGLSLLLDRS
jgi:UDP-glucose 4-epimerase